MQNWALRSTRYLDRVLTVLGVGLIVIGLVTGWIVPHLSVNWFPIQALQTPVGESGIDTTTFLGADITTLAVIIAVLIGYNVAALQIAGQMLSLAFVRAILLSLGPFLLWWLLSTVIALVYLLVPPLYVGQLWQVLFWFGAVTFFMVGYLWSLPFRLSADYAAVWAIKDLRAQPVTEWIETNGYATLETGISSAITRSDTSSMRTMAVTLGTFLAGVCDRHAEDENRYQRGRYRTLKNLLSNASYNAATAPNAVAYYLGFVAGGTLLQTVALGQPIVYEGTDLFSGLIRPLKDSADKIDAMWTGMRHSLCRKGPQGEPLLIQYWRAHLRWSEQDARRVERVADGIACLHDDCWQTLRAVLSPADADARAAELISDFYSYIDRYLVPEIHQQSFQPLTLQLLETLHAHISQHWLADSHVPLATLTAAMQQYQSSMKQAMGK
jgi:hypothetical protein